MQSHVFWLNTFDTCKSIERIDRPSFFACFTDVASLIYDSNHIFIFCAPKAITVSPNEVIPALES